ncbi:MAG: response regulator [Candidatus Omnitrophica bacterium]|nr:response regulator [Candidatus Omnitrophota bacterium]
MSEKTKITIIEDDQDLVEFIQNFLQRRDFLVTTANDGRRGLEVIREEKPDLVILDIMMPDMDGIEVLNELKKSKDTKNIPVVMLTAKDTQPDRIRALELGAYEYIAKPLDTHMLLRQINNVLSKRKEGLI